MYKSMGKGKIKKKKKPYVYKCFASILLRVQDWSFLGINIFNRKYILRETENVWCTKVVFSNCKKVINQDWILCFTYVGLLFTLWNYGQKKLIVYYHHQFIDQKYTRKVGKSWRWLHLSQPFWMVLMPLI